MAEVSSPAEFSTLADLRVANRELMERLAVEDDDDLSAPMIVRVQEFREQAGQTGAYLSAPEERQEAQSILNFWLTVLYNAGRNPPSVLLADFDQAAALARSAGAHPYKGLEPFQSDDQARFFGRKRALRDLLDKVGQVRLLAVTGLSGSGKSSVVRAGLIPDLAVGAVSGSQSWKILEPILPGADPLRALNDLLRQSGLDDADIRKPADLPKALDSFGVPTVLSVDQFEEAFTLAEPDADRTLFFDSLVAAATKGRFRHLVILTMRSEYDTHVEVNEKLARLVGKGRVTIGALSGPELRTAIVQPAAQLGVLFEQGLVEELVHAVLGEPAGLPLLQFTLLELWKHREGGVMTLSAYHKLGGSPRVILAQRAGEVFESFPIAEDRTRSRRIFARLVQIGSGLEATGRRVLRSDLDSLGDARDNIDRVLEVWRSNGLIRVSPPGPILPASKVEVAHEALIRNWDQLVAWVEADVIANRSRRILRAQASDWAKGKDTLLGELSLKEAEAYEGLDSVERPYVLASRAEVDRQHRWARGLRLGAIATLVTGGVLIGWGGVQTWAVSRLEKNLIAGEKVTRKLATLAQRQQELAERSEERLIDANAKLDIVNRDIEAAEIKKQDAEIRIREANERIQVAEGRMRVADRRVQEADLVVMAAEGRIAIAVSRKEQVERELAEKIAANEALVADNQKFETDLSAARQTVVEVRSELSEQAEQRPAIRIQSGRLQDIPAVWRLLMDQRRNIETAARSVGRLDATGPGGSYFSTAFLVGPNIAVALLPNSNRAQMLTVDFRDRPDADPSRRFRVLRVIETVDLGNRGLLGYLELAPRNAAGEPLPAPLEISDVKRPALRTGKPVLLIGYPTRGGASNPQVAEIVLGAGDGVKRAAPGVLLSWTEWDRGLELQYDNSTFYGNGGSPIYDIGTGQVIGFHFGATSAEKTKGQANSGFSFDQRLIPPLVRSRLNIKPVKRPAPALE